MSCQCNDKTSSPSVATLFTLRGQMAMRRERADSLLKGSAPVYKAKGRRRLQNNMRRLSDGANTPTALVVFEACI